MSGTPKGVSRTASPRPAGAIQAQNVRGEWVPSIPEPFFLGNSLRPRYRCSCGETRKSRLAYREHYALVHIVGMDG
jgi:hypothetical protein